MLHPFEGVTDTKARTHHRGYILLLAKSSVPMPPVSSELPSTLGHPMSSAVRSVEIAEISVSAEHVSHPQPVTALHRNLPFSLHPGKHFLDHITILSCWPSLKGRKEEEKD